MSACHYEFTFYFRDDVAHKQLSEILSEEMGSDECLQALALDSVVNEGSEHLEDFSLKSKYLQLSFMNSTSAPFNHQLVRKSKNWGSEFCKVDLFNDQVGEGDTFYLFRGRRQSGEQLQSLIDQYDPAAKIEQLLASSDEDFAAAIDAGADPNMLIDDEPILLAAFQHDNKIAFDLLLKHGANPNATDSNDDPVLLAITDAVEFDAEGYLAALISKGAQYDIESEEGGSFLWHLGVKDRVLTKQLVSQGAEFVRPDDAYECDEDDCERLGTAVRHADEEKILSLEATLRGDKENFARMASIFCEYDEELRLKSLLQHDSVSNELAELLEISAGAGAMSAVQTLLDHADEKSIDYEAGAEELIESLVSCKQSVPLITRIVARYPDSISRYAVTNAIENGSSEILYTLLENGFKDNPDEDDESLLHQCIDELTPAIARTLLKNRCDPLETDYDGKTVLEYVFHQSYTRPNVQPAFDDWISAQTDVKALEAYCLVGNAGGFHDKWGRLSEQERSSTNLQEIYNSSLRRGHSALSAVLIDLGVDAKKVDEAGNSSLVHAIYAGDTASCKVLIAASSDPDALVFAPETDDDEDDDEDVGIALRAMGLDENALDDDDDDLVHSSQEISDVSSSCLMLAAEQGHLEIVSLLIEAGADVNRHNDIEFTALTYAATNSNSNVVNVLLQSGADASLVDTLGNAPLHYAAWRGSLETVELLLPGTDIDTNNYNHSTPLLMACASSDDEGNRQAVIRHLVENGANINARDKSGMSGLCSASAAGDTLVIKCLLSLNADTNVVSKEAYTAFDYYSLHGRKPVGFTLDQLQATDKSILIKKAFAKFVQLSRRIVPVAIVAYLLSLWSPAFGLVVAIVGIGFWLAVEAWNYKQISAVRKLASEPGDNMMLRGLQVFADVANQVREDQAANQQVIDSWEDDDWDKAA